MSGSTQGLREVLHLRFTGANRDAGKLALATHERSGSRVVQPLLLGLVCVSRARLRRRGRTCDRFWLRDLLDMMTEPANSGGVFPQKPHLNGAQRDSSNSCACRRVTFDGTQFAVIPGTSVPHVDAPPRVTRSRLGPRRLAMHESHEPALSREFEVTLREPTSRRDRPRFHRIEVRAAGECRRSFSARILEHSEAIERRRRCVSRSSWCFGDMLATPNCSALIGMNRAR
jgi:hypothetical protein